MSKIKDDGVAGKLSAAEASDMPEDQIRLDPERAIADAEWLYQAYIEELQQKFEAFRARQEDAVIESADLKAAVEGAKVLRQAIHMLMDERGKIDKYRKQITEGIGGSLDLDAARDEIGLRLACLRRAAAG